MESTSFRIPTGETKIPEPIIIPTIIATPCRVSLVYETNILIRSKQLVIYICYFEIENIFLHCSFISLSCKQYTGFLSLFTILD
jgi:hypothetical protein